MATPALNQRAVAPRATGRRRPAFPAPKDLSFAHPQPVSAVRAWPLGALAVRVIRATVESSATFVLASHQPPGPALAAGDIGRHRATEDSDIVLLHQLLRERRRRPSLHEQICPVPGSSHRDVQQPALLRVGVAFAFGEHEIEQRIIGNLAGKPVSARVQPPDDDVVGLKPLRAMNRTER